MPREVFRRPSSQPNAALSAAKLSEPRREVLAPGSYDVVVDEARLVSSRSRPNDVSVALTLRDADSGTLIDVRPLWIAGPNSNRGPMAARNQAILVDLLTAIEVPETSYAAFTDPLLAQLAGKIFAVEIGVDQGRLGDATNRITRVDGLVVNEPSVLPFKAAAAAD